MVIFCVVVGCGHSGSGDDDVDPGDDDPSNPDLVIATGVTPNATVTFFDDAGELIAEVAADATGTAQAVMPDGGHVAVLDMNSPIPDEISCSGRITTGVKPGDRLSFFEAQPRVNSTFVSVWFTPDTEGTTTLYSPCGSTPVPATQPGGVLSFYSDCVAPTFDLMAVVHKDPPAQSMFVNLPDVSYVEGMDLALTDAFVPMSTASVNLHGADSASLALSVKYSALIAGSDYATFATTTSDSSDQSVVVPSPGVFEGSDVVVSWGAREVDVLAPGTAAVDVDLTALPTVELTWTPNGFTWSNSTGTSADAILAVWAGEYDKFSTPSVSMRYQVIGPWGDHVSVPRLPDKYEACDPNQHASQEQDFTYFFTAIDYDDLAGYDAFRQQPGDLFAPLATIHRLAGRQVRRSMTTAIQSSDHH